VINWQSFSIGSGGAINFQQPNGSTAVLNVVTTGSVSPIMGVLTQSGTIQLTAPNGGPGAGSISVGGAGITTTGSPAVTTGTTVK
jgi:filamentous hemagglutinin family protein